MWQPIHHLMSQNILAKFKAYPRGKKSLSIRPKSKKEFKKKKKSPTISLKSYFKTFQIKKTITLNSFRLNFILKQNTPTRRGSQFLARFVWGKN